MKERMEDGERKREIDGGRGRGKGEKDKEGK